MLSPQTLTNDSSGPEALYASLRPLLDAIDLDRDLNEQETPSSMAAMSISASSDDEQLYSDEWIKLSVLVERGIITTDQWRSMAMIKEMDKHA